MLGIQKWRSFLPTGVALLLISAVASYPYWVGEGVPRTNDLVPHLHRAFALREMITFGHLWPRWAADLVHGYGYPVFNFFPILSHWLIVLWHLAGLPLLSAYKMTVWTHAFLTALFSYGLGRAVSGRALGGWLTALIYTLSPYLLYDAIVRGSPPESQALACLPLLVWGVWRLLQPEGNHLKWGLITAAAYAVMILSHHPVTLQISLIMGVWMIIDLVFELRMTSDGLRVTSNEIRNTKYEIRNKRSTWAWRLARPVGALLLGGLLSAFFSLPALIEIDATRATLSISQGYTYQNNFLPLRDLFRWPLLPADPARINPPVVRPLPLTGLAAALLAVPLAWPSLSRLRRRLLIGLSGTALLAVWLITPTSVAAWRIVPLLEYTLYPWRMLGWISLVVAVVAAICVSSVAERSKSLVVYWSIGLLVTAIVGVEAAPWLFPPREPMPREITQQIVAENEIPPLLIGTTTLGEFLPVGVKQLPESAVLKQKLIDQKNPDRLLPKDGVTWDRLDPDPIKAHYTITAAAPTLLTYRQFFFPGWRVFLNDQLTPYGMAANTGLITIRVPPGTHDVRIEFGTTPVRTAGNIFSLIAAGVWVLGIGYLVFRRQTTDVRLLTSDSRHQGLPFEKSRNRSRLQEPQPICSLLSVVCGLFLVGQIALISNVESPLRRPTLLPNGVWRERPFEPLDFAGELRLLTYDVSAETIAADETVTLTTFWSPLRPIGVEYVLGIQVVDDQDLTWQADVSRTADWRFVGGSDVWPQDGYRLEPFDITLLDGTPPGSYRFLAGLVRKDTGQTVAAHSFGTLTVTQAAAGDRPLEPGMNPIDEPVGGQTVLGIKADREDARPGDPVRLGILWQRRSDRPQPFTLALIVPNRPEMPVWQSKPLNVPSGAAGERLRVDRVHRLPAGLPTGSYRWQIRTAEETITVANPLTVEAPERLFDQPGIDNQIEARFGDVATLVGWVPCSLDLPACEIELIWRSEAETEVNYRVFVHLVDVSGQILAQSDGEPAAWSRPTTGWLPPEYIVDRHTLTLPHPLLPGPLSMRVGLYDPATGERVKGERGAEFVEVELEGGGQ